MVVRRINSENPKADQWRLIGQFAYPPNITRHTTARGLTPGNETIDSIAACVRQSEAYFSASESSPLDISPLLLYYGATNLLAGTVTLLSGKKPPIDHHGLSFFSSGKIIPRIADFEIKPVNAATGALQNFVDVLAPGCVMTNGSVWTVEEIFGSIPDLLHEFVNCYHPTLPFCIPAFTIDAEMHGIKFSYDQVETAVLQRYPDHYAAISSVANCKETYLTPRYNIPSERVNLFYKDETKDAAFFSIFGEKYLPLVHIKDRKPLSPPLAILMLMGLYALGYLSRYHPERWNAFVRTDESGERLVVEKFLSVCHRYLPNLILNYITDSRVQFIGNIS